MDAAQPIEVGSYDQLIETLRRRVAELGITFETVDEIGGLASRYASKLLCNPPIKGFGPMSLWTVLGALGLKLQLCSDTEALERLRRREEWLLITRHGPRYRRPGIGRHNGPRPKRRRGNASRTNGGDL